MTEESKAIVPVENGVLVPKDLDGLWRIANIYVKGGMVPKEYKGNTEKTFVAMEMGMHLGLTFGASLQLIGVVRGKPGVYGDGIPGLINSGGQLENREEYFELNGEKLDNYIGPEDLAEWPRELQAVCILKRKGIENPYKGFFSVADAIRQGSWNKPTDNGYLSVWQKHPLRMLKMRARAFAARDGFADCLHGLGVVEELRDTPEINYDADAEIVETPDSPVDEALDGLSAKDTKTEEKPENEPSAKPQAQNNEDSEPSKDNILVAALINRGHDRELIDAFLAMAADANDLDEEALVKEAYQDLDEFESNLRSWGEQVFYPSQMEGVSTDGENVSNTETNSEQDETPFQDTPPPEIDEDGVAAGTDPDKKKEILDKAAEAGMDLKPASEVPENVVEINPETGKAMTDEEWVSYFHDQYNHLNKATFSPFVLKNTAGFAKLYKLAPTVYQKAQLKWKRFYPKDEWPVSASMREGE
jgi:hypothetical protein